MKSYIKSTITLGLIMTGLLFSCKQQDGYSDEVKTNQNPGNTTTGDTVNDYVDENNGSLGTDIQPAAQSTGAQSTSSEATNPGKTEPGNNAKGTGTGGGPGPSAKDGAVYTPNSDPKQNPKLDTIKNNNKKQH